MTETDKPTDLSAIVIEHPKDPSSRLRQSLERLARKSLRFEYVDEVHEAERLANTFDSDVILIVGHRQQRRTEQILDRVYAWPEDPAIVVLTEQGRGNDRPRRHGPHVYLDKASLEPDLLRETIDRAIERLNIRRSAVGNEKSPARATLPIHPLPDGDFVPHYQPIYNLNDGSTHGVELLARWQSPDRGLLRPDDAFPRPERTDILSDIGHALLAQCFRQFRNWLPNDPLPDPLPVHINLNDRQLTDPNAFEPLERIVDDEMPDTIAVCYEVTEPALHDHHRRLTQLRRTGHRILIDDFGSGFSALRELKDADIDGLKIAMPFIQGMTRSPETAALCETLIGLGRRLGLTTVAEGVETRPQLDRLRTFGCTAAQGFHLAEPLSFAELQDRLTADAGATIFD